MSTPPAPVRTIVHLSDTHILPDPANLRQLPVLVVYVHG